MSIAKALKKCEYAMYTNPSVTLKNMVLEQLPRGNVNIAIVSIAGIEVCT